MLLARVHANIEANRVQLQPPGARSSQKRGHVGSRKTEGTRTHCFVLREGQTWPLHCSYSLNYHGGQCTWHNSVTSEIGLSHRNGILECINQKPEPPNPAVLHSLRWNLPVPLPEFCQQRQRRLPAPPPGHASQDLAAGHGAWAMADLGGWRHRRGDAVDGNSVGQVNRPVDTVCDCTATACVVNACNSAAQEMTFESKPLLAAQGVSRKSRTSCNSKASNAPQPSPSPSAGARHPRRPSSALTGPRHCPKAIQQMQRMLPMKLPAC